MLYYWLTLHSRGLPRPEGKLKIFPARASAPYNILPLRYREPLWAEPIPPLPQDTHSVRAAYRQISLPQTRWHALHPAMFKTARPSSLRNGLDRDVYQVLRRLEDEG